MLSNISIEEAQATLPEIIGKLGPGEEVILTHARVPLIRIW